MNRALRARRVVNLVNLSTPLGLLLGAVGTRGRDTVRAPGGLLVRGGYRLPLPDAPAFTVGNVILVRGAAGDLLARPALLRHEGRHATQYAFCLGPVMLVAYPVCAGVSLLLCGDHASYNPFERLAGLEEGGYRRRPPWFARR
ncbi:hypothetical protein GCM10009678_52370 [Actinomadura kijaniata]|uniref:DUF4157 domain-containing protein n=1 Tax=Actinomadura namibiensis TaxID=182080 RepID=A0A7W3QMB3_ACTNM|nr:hypothetical protein [Actinomadura namibiensis]MBA8952379.1 hypothetical protein [Actinomadura namibiensis]